MKKTTDMPVGLVITKIQELEELKSKFHLSKNHDTDRGAVMEITNRLSFSDMQLIARLINYRIQDLRNLTVNDYPTYD